MSYPPPDGQSAAPLYKPAEYLVSGSGGFLTSEELVRYFEDFYSILGFVNTAPQMVFERLIGNLNMPVQAAIAKARQASASGDSGARITCLQVSAPTFPALVALPPTIPALTVPSPTVPSPTILDHEVPQTPLLAIHSFSVGDCTERDASSAFPCTKAFPTAGIANLSRFAIGLTSFQMPNIDRFIASASITTAQDTGISVTLSNVRSQGYSSRLKSASCSWLQLDDGAADMQCGVWGLGGSDGSNVPERLATYKIPFPMVYQQSPQLLVWLRGLHIETSLDRSLGLRVFNSSGEGFNLEVSSRTASSLHGVDISWLACSMNKPRVTIGTFEAVVLSGQTKCEGYFAFERGLYKAPPRVAVGLMGFVIEKQRDLCLSVEVVQVTTEGMKWRIDSGLGGNLKLASGSFIALE